MTRHPVSQERLLAFAGDELAERDAREVEEHVRTCASCAGAVARYRAIRDTVREGAGREPPPETVARAQRIFEPARSTVPREPNLLERLVATLTFDSRAGLALAGVRGGAGAYQLAYECEAASVDLQLFPPAESAGSPWRILGQVSETGPGSARAAGLHREGKDEEVNRMELGEDRMFEFVVASGSWEVRIEMPGCLVVLPGIEVP